MLHSDCRRHLARRHAARAAFGLVAAVWTSVVPRPVRAREDWTLLGWNNLGMHCMDGDYSVFSLLPPFNTIHAQLIGPDGRLVREPAGITVTYEAVVDPDGSINTTSDGKTNFWDHAESLFGVALPADDGLAGNAMPGAANRPQPMSFDPAAAWFVAEGIPITPTDDAGRRNPYPLMRLTARGAAGQVLATTDIVLPVSDEMSCAACHASDSHLGARPSAGWVHDPNAERDTRLNILLLHDDREQGRAAYASALAAAGYSPSGLFATATEQGRAVLCARCHASEALPGSGLAGVSPLTQAVHRRMAPVFDPVSGTTLDSVGNRSACYRCHPGSTTRCLRGAMGAAVAPDGSLAIQCQSCHGSMRDVAAAGRTGWLEEPTCQSCHTGTALHNNGAIRYTTTFEPNGEVRVPVDATFATNADTPADGLSLYRFSIGHAGLACAACHGSTHAEFPSSHRNDNLQSLRWQGHAGVVSECSTCHAESLATVSGGPHGLHPLGQAWVDEHGDVAEEGGAAACRTCHGIDYRGTVLSRAQADRTLRTDFGTKRFWRGFEIGCYTCHLGPDGERANPNRAPVVRDAEVATEAGTPVTLELHAEDADGDPLSLRVVSQPGNGTVGLSGNLARYFPKPGFTGRDRFTFAARDGSTDSNLGSVAAIVSPSCPGDCTADGRISIDELVLAVRIALEVAPRQSCPTVDTDGDGLVAIDELVAAVHTALTGC